MYGNEIIRNGRHLLKPYLSSGVFIRDGESNVISANDISQNAERGVYALGHVSGNEIIHNTITDNGHTAIETNDGNGLVIKNNHVSDTHDAVIIHHSYSSVVSNNGSSVSFIPPAKEPGPAADSSSPEKKEIEEKIDPSDSLSRLKEAPAEKSLPASLKRAILMYRFF
ncbi:right-handed parallel beta-helix repeat-containing protein [Domibacillus sp.]|uniref:right-handed parallel beta-helix repeat-containing protein n=1 Tax=Domibacillus sp. TaxID=1969783 RepID=UPI0028117B56|nr:right-handed parallel beta-helix repeat-containing protein [Domibacillus sp.]